VTLLARLDLDPWQEAARLAALAPEAAALTVTSVLEALPNASFNPRDNVSLAGRLVAMLPRATVAHGTMLQSLFATSGQTATRWRESVLFLAIYLIVMLATQFAMTNIDPNHSNAASTSASNSAPSQSVSVPSGK
jgi:membrane glycosyltransferase